MQGFEPGGKDLDALFEVFCRGAGLVGVPADAVDARGRAVARAFGVFDLGAHAEELRDVRVEALRPGAVRGEWLEAVEEVLVDAPLGRSDRVPFETDDRGETRAAR